MNKETVDYALQRLNEAFQSIKPDALELGSEYVNYVVWKATVEAALLMILLLLMIPIVLFFIWKKKKDSYGEWEIGIVISSVLMLFLSITVMIASYSAILADKFPLMYTIESLIK